MCSVLDFPFTTSLFFIELLFHAGLFLCIICNLQRYPPTRHYGVSLTGEA